MWTLTFLELMDKSFGIVGTLERDIYDSEIKQNIGIYDNFDICKTRLFTGDEALYHVYIVQRSKDGHLKATKSVAHFHVKNGTELEFLKPGIISLCELYNARAYINLNGKLQKPITINILTNITEGLKSNNFQCHNLFYSSMDQVLPRNKVWVLDCDDTSINKLENIIKVVNGRKTGSTNGAVITALPTPNGFHLLTHPFDKSEFQIPNVEVKTNSPTLLYYKKIKP